MTGIGGWLADNHEHLTTPADLAEEAPMPHHDGPTLADYAAALEALHRLAPGLPLDSLRVTVHDTGHTTISPLVATVDDVHLWASTLGVPHQSRPCRTMPGVLHTVESHHGDVTVQVLWVEHDTQAVAA